MHVQILLTTKTGQDVAGEFSATPSGVTYTAAPGNDALMQDILGETINGATAKSQPEAWLSSLPRLCNSSYLRAKIVGELHEVGTASSGDRGHKGRPGERGGSEPSGAVDKKAARLVARQQAMAEKIEKTTGLTREQFKANIEKALDEATDGEKKRGMSWYEEAHDYAKSLSEKYHVSLETAAAVIAATSPQKSWEANMRSAEQLMQNPDIKNYSQYGLTRQVLGKAIGIFKDGYQNDDQISQVTSQKTRNFFHNIVDPSDPQWITIDRHAVQLAVGRELAKTEVAKVIGNDVDYNYWKSMYHEVAEERGYKVPNDLQAITWTHWTVNHARSVDRDLLRQRGIAEAAARDPFATPIEVPGWPDYMQPYTTDADYTELVGIKEAGTASSGDYAHAGRPGERGGSAPSGKLSKELRDATDHILTKWVYSSVSPQSVQLRRQINHLQGQEWNRDLTPQMLETWSKGTNDIALSPILTLSKNFNEYAEFASQRYDEKFPDHPMLYRGVGGDEAIAVYNSKPGDKIHFGTLTSTSLDQNVAQAFSIQHPMVYDEAKQASTPVVIEIEGVTGKDVFASEASSPLIFDKSSSRQQEVILYGNKHDWIVIDNYKTFGIDLRDPAGKEVKMRYITVKAADE